MSKETPSRIEPIDEMPENLEEETLISEEEAVLTQSDNIIEGKLYVTQQWTPMIIYLEFFPIDARRIDGLAYSKAQY